MSSKLNLEKLFKEWNELNSSAEESFGQFNFSKIKEIRAKQKKLEDTIYEILIQNAPDEFKVLLPDDCGQLEVGYDIEGEIFYFVMMDLNLNDEDEIKLIAFTIDIEKKVNRINDFKIEDS
ncbi:MAG: hypothetical protein ACFFEY_18245 [Candidatus Thorarchaeota archaeon]